MAPVAGLDSPPAGCTHFSGGKQAERAPRSAAPSRESLADARAACNMDPAWTACRARGHAPSTGDGIGSPARQRPQKRGSIMSTAGPFQPPAAPAGPARQPRTCGLAIASLICGIAGLATCGLSAIVGLILGIAAHGKIKRSAGQQIGRAHV